MHVSHHLIVVGVLVVYTTIMVFLIVHNNRSLRVHHACTDVSAPLTTMLASVMASAEGSAAPVASAIERSSLRDVRIVVAKDGNVVADSSRPGTRGPLSDVHAAAIAGATDASPDLHFQVAHAPGGRYVVLTETTLH